MNYVYIFLNCPKKNGAPMQNLSLTQGVSQPAQTALESDCTGTKSNHITWSICRNWKWWWPLTATKTNHISNDLKNTTDSSAMSSLPWQQQMFSVMCTVCSSLWSSDGNFTHENVCFKRNGMGRQMISTDAAWTCFWGWGGGVFNKVRPEILLTDVCHCTILFRINFTFWSI